MTQCKDETQLKFPQNTIVIISVVSEVLSKIQAKNLDMGTALTARNLLTPTPKKGPTTPLENQCLKTLTLLT